MVDWLKDLLSPIRRLLAGERWTVGRRKQMDFHDLMAPVAGEFDADEALETWRWLVPERVRPLVITAFGDLFLIRDDGSILFLDTKLGTSSRVADSMEEWEEKIRQPELLDEWCLPGLVEELRKAGRYLSEGQCYSARHSIVLGGTWSVQNWLPMDWQVHFEIMGQLLRQVKDLPPGTKITAINYPKL